MNTQVSELGGLGGGQETGYLRGTPVRLEFGATFASFL